MIIRVPLLFVFGEGSTQDINSLTIPISPSWTAEGLLSNLLANLLALRQLPLSSESGERLTDEQENPLTGALFFNSIECEKWKISLIDGKRITQIFVGINETL